MINIYPAGVADIPHIQQIAETTWWPTYEPIVGTEQVRYMLDMFYSTDVLTRQMTGNEQAFIIIAENNQPVGFASYGPRKENPDVYKLYKLYCLPETQGKGYGRMLVEKVEQAVVSAGKHILELNVNRSNNAKDFYARLGYTLAYDEDIDIDNGFFMNDHVLRKEL